MTIAAPEPMLEPSLAARSRLRERATLDFLEDCRGPLSSDRLVSLFGTLAARFGFAHLGIFDMARDSPADALRVTTFPLDAITLFMREQASIAADPVWTRARWASRPYRWASATREGGHAASGPSAFFRRIGLVDGLTIPVHVPSAPRSCLFLGAADPLELTARDEALLTLATGVFVADLLAQSTPTVDDRLTGRERQILAAIARGQSAREIADTLRSAETTVVRHLHNIRAKLGANNTVQAVAIAVRDRLISV